MGVGMCLYAQLVQTNNKQCRNRLIVAWYNYKLTTLYPDIEQFIHYNAQTNKVFVTLSC